MSVMVVCCECGRTALVSEPTPVTIYRELAWFSSDVTNKETGARALRPLCGACAPKIYAEDELGLARVALGSRAERKPGRRKPKP